MKRNEKKNFFIMNYKYYYYEIKYFVQGAHGMMTQHWGKIGEMDKKNFNEANKCTKQ